MGSVDRPLQRALSTREPWAVLTMASLAEIVCAFPVGLKLAGTSPCLDSWKAQLPISFVSPKAKPCVYQPGLTRTGQDHTPF